MALLMAARVAVLLGLVALCAASASWPVEFSSDRSNPSDYSLEQGGAVGTFKLTVKRKGFDGDVALTVTGLPTGVDYTIGESGKSTGASRNNGFGVPGKSQVTVQLQFSARGTAPAGVFTVQVRASGKKGRTQYTEKVVTKFTVKIKRRPTPTPTKKPTPTATRTASRTPTKSRTPSGTPTASRTPSGTPTPKFVVIAAPVPVIVPRNNVKIPFVVDLTRAPAWTGIVLLTPVELPRGVRVQPDVLTLSSTETRAWFNVSAKPDAAALGLAKFVIVGTGYAKNKVSAIEKLVVKINVIPSPTPTPTATGTPTASLAPTATPTPSVTPTATPTSSVTPTTPPTASLSPTAIPTASASPTAVPTDEPTPSPTEPTASPTNEPTPSPTEEPTSSPTEEPTSSPTEEPTPSPTEEPTPSPTEEPTPSPTEEPTPSPTEEPTPSPTDEPTPSPTEEPTPSPSPL